MTQCRSTVYMYINKEGEKKERDPLPDNSSSSEEGEDDSPCCDKGVV